MVRSSVSATTATGNRRAAVAPLPEVRLVLDTFDVGLGERGDGTVRCVERRGEEDPGERVHGRV